MAAGSNDEPLEPGAQVALEHISENIGVLAAAMHDLVIVATGDMQLQIKKSGRTTRWFVIGLGLLVAGLIVLSFSNRALLDDKASASAQIADCTTPGGECYMRAQEQLVALLAQLNASADQRANLSVAAAVCAVRPDLCTNGVPNPGVLPDTTTTAPTTTTTGPP